MPGLSLTLETSRSTLLSTQLQIQTASHNIANAENTSYARQKAVLGTSPPYFTHGGWVGTGANVDQVVQVRDRFIEQRLMKSTCQESYYRTLSSQLAVVRTSFSENGENGISGALGAFWDSWDALVQNPAGLTEQTGVYQSTRSLVDAINTTYNDLNELANTQMPQEVNDTITRANALIDQISGYNQQIAQSETPGYSANDLRDARYQALKELSELLPIQISEDPQGLVTVTTTDGVAQITLVNQAQAGSLAYDPATQVISYTQAGGSSGTAADTFPGGSLGGILAAQRNVDDYIQRLTDFTNSIVSAVNSLHTTGGGTPVFTQTGLQPSQLLDVDPTFQIDPSAAVEADRALAISSLQDEPVNFPDGTMRFSGYLADIQHTMGVDQQSALSLAEFNEMLRSDLEAQQQSVSGVSLDEEMVDLLKHQQVYQAAAKIIQQANELLNKIIDLI